MLLHSEPLVHFSLSIFSLSHLATHHTFCSPYFELFAQILHIVQVRLLLQPRSVSSFLQTLLSRSFPVPGEALSLRGSGFDYKFLRPDHDRLPLGEALHILNRFSCRMLSLVLCLIVGVCVWVFCFARIVYVSVVACSLYFFR